MSMSIKRQLQEGQSVQRDVVVGHFRNREKQFNSIIHRASFAETVEAQQIATKQGASITKEI